MVKKVSFFLVNLFVVFVVNAVVNFAYPSKKNKLQQENHAPAVKITAPKNNSIYNWNSAVNYTITVSDQEDGESKFQEISSNEVFLRVKYVADTSKATAQLNAGQSAKQGLMAIGTSNCLNCHAFNTKLIGPSFYDINKRYPVTKVNTELLEKHIREGSTGVWGNVTMPTHPELNKEDIQNIVDWIFKNGAEPDVNYYRGTEGSFKMKPPVTAAGKGVLVLTASYLDHGVKDKPKQHLEGEDRIILQTR